MTNEVLILIIHTTLLSYSFLYVVFIKKNATLIINSLILVLFVFMSGYLSNFIYKPYMFESEFLSSFPLAILLLMILFAFIINNFIEKNNTVGVVICDLLFFIVPICLTAYLLYLQSNLFENIYITILFVSLIVSNLIQAIIFKKTIIKI